MRCFRPGEGDRPPCLADNPAAPAEVPESAKKRTSRAWEPTRAERTQEVATEGDENDGRRPKESELRRTACMIAKVTRRR